MTTGKRCGVWRKNENNRRNEILSGGKKKLQTGKVEKLSEEQMKWFRDAKFGMFIHWGVYSMLGKGEWVLMNEHLDVRKYETLKDDFLAEILMRNSGPKMQRQRG